MNYIELKFSINPQTPFQDILIAELAEIGFESFEETKDGLLAYIQEHAFDEKKLSNLDILNNALVKISYSVKQIPAQNWNAVWESNYNSVLIDERCYIRAPFHPSKPDVEFELLIEPQMSFGTAHHETTSNMISLLLNEDVAGKSFLDMGCGTAVLAILAYKKGASPIFAIDNDEWAYRNSIDNIAKNNIQDIQVFQGDAALLAGKSFDIIFANINKNILLSDMNIYSQSLNKNGKLFMSGFYRNDLKDISEKAAQLGLEYSTHIVDNEWVAAMYTKI
ncbi:MAG: 50S ribosomal protein L11 methyltransferase [Bacteroidales bacterium]|jgi:ribosomal protein L11 methyltransferase|nr:50S ribosomal protein L11 methyltransferase [Bacteroidales bacterium]